MRSAVLGVFGSLMLLMILAMGFGIYDRTVRENQMVHNLSRAVKQVLATHYEEQQEKGETRIEVAESLICEELLQLLGGSEYRSSEREVSVEAYDFVEGILSVTITERYHTPFGQERLLSCQRTAIIDDEEDYTDSSAIVFERMALNTEGFNAEGQNTEYQTTEEEDSSDKATPDLVIQYMANRYEGDDAFVLQEEYFDVGGTYYYEPPWENTGYQFVRWYQPANTWIPYYDAGEYIIRGWKILYAPVAYLYAEWTPNTYRVTYIDEGKKLGTIIANYESVVKLMPWKKDCFIGWRLGEEHGPLLQEDRIRLNEVATQLGVENQNGASIFLYAAYQSDEPEETEQTEEIEDASEPDEPETERAKGRVRFINRKNYETLGESSKWRTKPECILLLRRAGIIYE